MSVQDTPEQQQQAALKQQNACASKMVREEDRPAVEVSVREPMPSPSVTSEANRDAAEAWLARAETLYDVGKDAEALRLLAKSLQLCATAKARSLDEHIRSFGEGSAPAKAAERVLNLAPHDHYGVLELSRGTATPAKVKKAYLSLARSLHPDRNHSRQAEAAFKRVQNAYEVLSKSHDANAHVGGGMGGTWSSTDEAPGSAQTNASYQKPPSRDAYEDELYTCERCGSTADVDEDELCAHCLADLTCTICKHLREEDIHTDSTLPGMCRTCRLVYGFGKTPGSRKQRNDPRCYSCNAPYRPPPSYAGSRPMCRDCREDDYFDDPFDFDERDAYMYADLF